MFLGDDASIIGEGSCHNIGVLDVLGADNEFILAV